MRRQGCRAPEDKSFYSKDHQRTDTSNNHQPNRAEAAAATRQTPAQPYQQCGDSPPKSKIGFVVKLRMPSASEGATVDTTNVSAAAKKEKTLEEAKALRTEAPDPVEGKR